MSSRGPASRDGLISLAQAARAASFDGTSLPDRYTSCRRSRNDVTGFPVSLPDLRSATSVSTSPAPTCVFQETTTGTCAGAPTAGCANTNGGPTPAFQRLSALI